MRGNLLGDHDGRNGRGEGERGCRQPQEPRADGSPHRGFGVGHRKDRCPAVRAFFQVFLQPQILGRGQAVSDGLGQQRQERFAGFLNRGGNVRFQISLTQAFPSPGRYRRDSIGFKTQQGGDPAGRFAFDVKVPQHRLPSCRQGGERHARQVTIGPVQNVVETRIIHWGVHRVLEQHHTGLGRPVISDTGPYSPEQVRTERPVRAVAALDGPDNFEESLRSGVIGVEIITHKPAGKGQPRGKMAAVKLLDSGVVTLFHTPDEILIR